MSEVRVNSLSNENNTGGPTISGITTFSGTNFFVPPQGDTASRPTSCPPGSLRFNTDTAHLEYYRGDTIGWQEVEASNVEFSQGVTPVNSGSATVSNSGLGHRGFAAGGHSGPSGPGYNATIDFYTIPSLGNAQDFGDLSQSRGNGVAGFASRVRGFAAGGIPSQVTIDFVIMSQTGTATDFGDLTEKREGPMGLSSSTRGIVAGGYSRPSFVRQQIDYVTMASAGDAKDFGDMMVNTEYGSASASTTRGLLIAGQAPGILNQIEFITIATQGNALDFGDLSQAHGYTASSASNATRSISWGGAAPNTSTKTNIIDFLTIATKGNSIDFGDTTRTLMSAHATASPTRSVCYGGNGGGDNVIEFVEIATTGNAADFGDTSYGSYGKYDGGAFSNGHGGL